MVNGRAIEKPRKYTGYGKQLLGMVVGLLPFLPGCAGGNNGDSAQVSISAGGARCAESVWLVGSVDPQKERHLSHTFTIQNQTDAPISIKDIKSDCGCLVAKDRPSEIPANGSIEIPVSFNVPPVPGPFNHSVVVKLGLAEPANLPLKIHGVAAPTPALYASPSSLDFGALTVGEKRMRTVQVSRYDHSPIEICGLKSDLEGCVLESKPVSDSDAIIVSMTLDGAKLRPGANEGFAEVNTRHPGYPSLRIQVKAETAKVIDAFISSFTDSVAPGESRTISLCRKDRAMAQRLRIERLEFSGDPDVQIELLTSAYSDEKDSPRVKLSVSSDAKPGVAKRGVIRIDFADRTSTSIEVSVIVFVR